MFRFFYTLNNTHCMKQISIDPEKTYTKTEYARAYTISRSTLDNKIQTKEIKSVKIKGATLIIAA